MRSHLFERELKAVSSRILKIFKHPFIYS